VPVERAAQLTGPVRVAGGVGVGQIGLAQGALRGVDAGLVGPHRDGDRLLLDGDRLLLARQPERLASAGPAALLDHPVGVVEPRDPLVERRHPRPERLMRLQLGIRDGLLLAGDDVDDRVRLFGGRRL
jgi:hypothetical protein